MHSLAWIIVDGKAQGLFFLKRDAVQVLQTTFDIVDTVLLQSVSEQERDVTGKCS